MADIRFKVQGSYPPFSVELREGSETGTVVDSQVVQSADTFYYFNSVSAGVEYYLVGYDTVGGQQVAITGFTTTTTTTTTTLAPTTTTTTTLPATTTTTTLPATTTTTTLPPTTTTTTTPAPTVEDVYYGFAIGDVLNPDLDDSNTNSFYPTDSNQRIRFWWSTDSSYDTSGTGTGDALSANVSDVDITITLTTPPSSGAGTATYSILNGQSNNIDNLPSLPINSNFGVSSLQLLNLSFPAGQKQGFVLIGFNLQVGETMEIRMNISNTEAKFQTITLKGGLTYGYYVSTNTTGTGEWGFEGAP